MVLDLSAALITVIPILALVGILSVTDDPALLRAIMSGGNLLGLIITMIAPLLPIIIGAVIMMVTLRTGVSFRVALYIFVTVTILLAFAASPARIGLVLIVLSVILVIVNELYSRAKRTSHKPVRRPNRIHPERTPQQGLRRHIDRFIFFIQFVAVFAQLQGTGLAFSNIPSGASALITDSLPAEVIEVKESITTRQVKAHIIQTGDQVTTIINPAGAVENLWNADIVKRTACSDQSDTWDRSILMLLSNQRSKTPSCAETYDSANRAPGDKK